MPRSLEGLPPRVFSTLMMSSHLEAVMAVEMQAYSFPWSRGNFIDALAAGYHAELLWGERPQHSPCLLGYFVAMPGVDELHLLNITVAPAWQGRGLAHRLMDQVAAHGLQHHLPTLWLEVREHNARALAFYARRGFVPVGRRRGYYPAGHGLREDALVMRLDLTPPAFSYPLEPPHALD